MRFRNTLQITKEYLLSKDRLSEKEQEILNKINEDLEYFPRGVLHRDDIIGYGYDSYLADDGQMEDLADRIGRDCWEQMSSVQIPIIEDSVKIPQRDETY